MKQEVQAVRDKLRAYQVDSSVVTVQLVAAPVVLRNAVVADFL